jgi:hypothetical protein
MPKASLRETVRNPGFYLSTTALTSSERINYFFILSSYSRLNKSSVLFLGIRERSISFSKVDEKFSFKQEEEHELAVASRRNIRAYV